MKKRFVIYGQSWYAGAQKHDWVDEIDIQIEMEKGEEQEGRMYEMVIQWHNMHFQPKPIPQLQIFDESWGAMAIEPALFMQLGKLMQEKRSPATVEDIVSILTKMGFADETNRENPYAERKAAAA
jgi:hypothetical protein